MPKNCFFFNANNVKMLYTYLFRTEHVVVDEFRFERHQSDWWKRQIFSRRRILYVTNERKPKQKKGNINFNDVFSFRITLGGICRLVDKKILTRCQILVFVSWHLIHILQNVRKEKNDDFHFMKWEISLSGWMRTMSSNLFTR